MRSEHIKRYTLIIITGILLFLLIILKIGQHSCGKVTNDSKRNTEIENEKINVLLQCQYRGGSSFLFHLLSGHPLTYRLFEPLHASQYNTTCKVDIMQYIFSCKQYPGLDASNNFYQNELLQMLKNNYEYKIAESLIDKWLCKNSLVNLVKTINFRMMDTEKLLEMPIVGRSLKIVYLVRDPRAMYVSRLHLKGNEALKETENSCEEIRQDVKTYQKLKSKYSKHILIIRYEDLATNPESVYNHLLNFTGINPKNIAEDHVQGFVSEIDKKENKRVYGTKKFSKVVYKQWVFKIKKDVLERLQFVCADILKLFKYNFLPMTNSTDLAKFNPIENFNAEEL